jgi:FlaA1/EpsC-like NDP-sugar epimerase
MLGFLDRFSRRERQAVLVMMDTGLFALTLWAAFAIRAGSWTPHFRGYYWTFLAVLLVTRIPIFVRLGLYRAALRYPSTKITRTAILGVLLSTLAAGTALFLLRPSYASRTALFVLEPLLAILAVIASREFLAHLMSRYVERARGAEPVIIYGAGVAGLQLAQSLQVGGQMRPIAFVDDDPSKWGMQLVDLDVHPSSRLRELALRHRVRTALLAVPSTDVDDRRAMLRRLEEAGLKVKEVPSILEILLGRQPLNRLHEVTSDELLARRVVLPDDSLLRQVVTGRTVMVTGAGGSIGSEICRQLAGLGPVQIVLYEISEYALYRIEMELAEAWPDLKVAAVLGSVLDESRLEETFRRFRVDAVFHTAAYKHVPLVEQNPLEGVRTNVFGTFLAARAAVRAGVHTFLLVSTDKAVRPTSVMGASKRMAELTCLMVQDQARNSALRFSRGARDNPTRFAIVRFGNVLDSAGSLVPLLRRQIARGGPVTVTHPEITRYFMTITEAAQLVIQASALGSGGEVFLLDMGEPVRIHDLAARMIELATLGTGRSIEIKITGLRPGEKLHEELMADPARSRPTSHPKIFMAMETGQATDAVHKAILRLEAALQKGQLSEVYAVLEEHVEGYRRPDRPADVLRRGETCYSFNGNGAAAPVLELVSEPLPAPEESPAPPASAATRAV